MNVCDSRQISWHLAKHPEQTLCSLVNYMYISKINQTNQSYFLGGGTWGPQEFGFGSFETP
jgi:hypothetical protein